MSILFDDVKATYGEKNKIMRKQIQQRRWSMTQGKIFKRHKFTKLVIWTCFKKKEMRPNSVIMDRHSVEMQDVQYPNH